MAKPLHLSWGPLPKEFCHLWSLPILSQTQKLSPMFQLLGSCFKSVSRT